MPAYRVLLKQIQHILELASHVCSDQVTDIWLVFKVDRKNVVLEELRRDSAASHCRQRAERTIDGDIRGSDNLKYP